MLFVHVLIVSTLPTISILLPVRNAQPYLSACLDSILAQTWTDWELLAINDHSTDDSGAVLEGYAATDARIRVWTAKGRGIIAALRQAYEQATGVYITRMDADDLMPVHKLQALWEVLQPLGRGHVATGLVRYFSSEGHLGEGYRRYANWLNELARHGQHYEALYKECVLPSPCWLLHRDDLEVAGAFASNRYPEDYDLCFRFYEQGLAVVAVLEVLHEWRDSSGRTSRHDPHYADNSFLPLKVTYFLKLHYDAARPLVIWGAGRKGKALAQLLQARGVAFEWVCDNPKKIGHTIYGTQLAPTTRIQALQAPQIIVVVAQQGAQAVIRAQLREAQPMRDVFFFC